MSYLIKEIWCDYCNKSITSHDRVRGGMNSFIPEEVPDGWVVLRGQDMEICVGQFGKLSKKFSWPDRLDFCCSECLVLWLISKCEIDRERLAKARKLMEEEKQGRKFLMDEVVDHLL